MLSDKRLAEIRAQWEECARRNLNAVNPPPSLTRYAFDVQDLLAEVDRLRADNDSQREQKCAAYREAAALEARLRARTTDG